MADLAVGKAREDGGIFRNFPPALKDVGEVIQTDTDDLGRARHGRKKLHFRQRKIGRLQDRGFYEGESGGTRPFRTHFRDPSFNNLQSAAAMCEGSQIADVIVAVASIDPVMGGVDR